MYFECFLLSLFHTILKSHVQMLPLLSQTFFLWIMYLFTFLNFKRSLLFRKTCKKKKFCECKIIFQTYLIFPSFETGIIKVPWKTFHFLNYFSWNFIDVKRMVILIILYSFSTKLKNTYLQWLLALSYINIQIFLYIFWKNIVSFSFLHFVSGFLVFFFFFF